MMINDLQQQALALQAWSSQHRRTLHQYPEISLQEQQTTQYCQQILKNLGYQVTPAWEHGFTADLVVNSQYPYIAIRAEMDALAIQELNQHDFVSKHPGVAHMCGHDAHMTIALTAAKLCIDNQAQLKCNVRFIFQPSEEVVPGGALGMIQAGCLEKVKSIYGLHNDPELSVGKIRTRVGALTAAADHFELNLIGHGSHAAQPHYSLDPITAGAQLIIDWQTAISRRVDPAHMAVLSIGKFQAGTTFNIIPEQALIAGTVRTYSEHDRQLIESHLRSSLLSLTARGYVCNFTYKRGFDSIVNHAEAVDHITTAAKIYLDKDAIDSNTTPAGWAEDFCYYLKHCPGAFYLLGSGKVGNTKSEPLHSPRFDVDETCLPLGALLMTQLVLNGQ